MEPITNLSKLGITLPPIPKSLASYVPAKKIGNLVFTSGQVPIHNEKILYPGIVGKNVSLEQAGEACKLACLNALAAIVSVTSSLEKIQSILKVGVFVASTPEFTEHHKIANYASELLISIFEERGKHVRFAVGVASLPLNAPVELEMIVEIQ